MGSSNNSEDTEILVEATYDPKTKIFSFKLDEYLHKGLGVIEKRLGTHPCEFIAEMITYEIIRATIEIVQQQSQENN